MYIHLLSKVTSHLSPARHMLLETFMSGEQMLQSNIAKFIKPKDE